MAVTIQGVVFVLTLTLTAMTGCFVLTPITTLPLIVFTKVLGHKKGAIFDIVHRWNNLIQGTWFYLVSWLIESMLKVKYDVTLINALGKSIEEVLRRPSKPGKFNIVISNHRTRIDWMLLWMLFAKTDLLFTLKIVLKGELSSTPFFGWTMQTFRFLFLSRKWEADKVHFDKVFKYMKLHDERATFLIFPEGSDLSPSNIEKSSKYAEEKKLPVFKHVLNPRVTGLVAMKNMIGADNIDHIFDITMGYNDHPQGGRPNEASLVNGCMPHRLHFLVSAHTIGPGDVPSDDAGFTKWIEKQFEKKESILSEFYSSSPCQFTPQSVRRAHNAGVTVDTRRDVHVPTWSIVLSLAVWILPTLYLWVWQVVIQRNVLFLLYVVLVSAFYVAVGKKFGGIDKWLMF
jgi:lysocardiolipin and lysophospholipid acyltransferase